MYDRYEAIEYLVKNAKSHNPWVKAGMWNQICYLTRTEKNRWTKDQLDILIKIGINYYKFTESI